MKNINIRYSLLLLLSILFTFVSCSDDKMKEVVYPSVSFTNTSLNKALQARGYSFNEKGELICDEKVMTTRSLDLSNCNLNWVYGLSSFESLEEINLSNNNFGDTFDFSFLPSSIKKVNLTGNDGIEVYKNLVSDGDKPIAKKNLSELILPKSAKWNLQEIVAFYMSSVGKAADIKINDGLNSLIQYNTLRDVPNEDLKSFLKGLYPSLFDSKTGKINIANTLKESNDLIMNKEYEDMEGVEYIIGNPNYKGKKVFLLGKKESLSSLEYLRVCSSIESLSMRNVNTENGIKLGNAQKLSCIRIDNNNSIEILDISSYKNSEVKNTNIFKSEICIENCQNFKSLILNKELTAIGKIELVNLPLLKDADFSSIEIINSFVLYSLPQIELKMPILLNNYIDGFGNIDENNRIYVATDESIKANSSFVNFAAMCSQKANLCDNSIYYKDLH